MTLQHSSSLFNHGALELTGEEEGLVYDALTPVVLDQYGNPYQGSMLVSWAAYMPEKNEEGQYTKAYEEIVRVPAEPVEGDEEPVEPPQDTFIKRKTADQLIQLSENGILQINPAQFDQPRTVAVRCLVYDPNNPDSNANRVILGEEVTVKQKEAPPPSNPGYYAPSELTVRFEPGEFGKLVGADSVLVEAGGLITGAPGVKSNEGYGFIGWSLNGEDTVDLGSLQVNNDMVLIALYKNVKIGAFITGYKDSTFRPQEYITRAEYVTMVVLALGGYDPETDYGDSFSDVNHASWYANYVAYAKKEKIVAGYSTGEFKPNQRITRGEAARILAVAAGLPLVNTKSFPDVPENRFFSTSIAALKDCGAANGFKDGTFRPLQYITRAEAVTLILGLTNNALDEVQKTNIKLCGYSPFTDVPRGYWAYAYILRAAGLA